uniref:ShKT domain-containing protein n=1 Tax=Strongyloides papillosus TaxID=174720 RepID=A0A0N5CI25_STREA
MKLLIIILLYLHKIHSAVQMMSCDTIRNSGMCYSSVNKAIICKSCYNACGFRGSNYCESDSSSPNTEECVDKMDCSSFISHCKIQNLIISLKGICDKTCGFCNDFTQIKPTIPTTTISNLVNTHQNDMCLSLRDL